MFNGQAFRLPGLWCCLGPVPLGKGSSPSLGISEVLLGTASGIHRCPGLRVGGGAPRIWGVTRGVGTHRCLGPTAGGGAPRTWGLSHGVGTHRCPGPRAGGGTPCTWGLCRGVGTHRCPGPRVGGGTPRTWGGTHGVAWAVSLSLPAFV